MVTHADTPPSAVVLNWDQYNLFLLSPPQEKLVQKRHSPKFQHLTLFLPKGTKVAPLPYRVLLLPEKPPSHRAPPLSKGSLPLLPLSLISVVHFHFHPGRN